MFDPRLFSKGKIICWFGLNFVKVMPSSLSLSSE
jgi:hypothetical protein